MSYSLNIAFSGASTFHPSNRNLHATTKFLIWRNFQNWQNTANHFLLLILSEWSHLNGKLHAIFVHAHVTRIQIQSRIANRNRNQTHLTAIASSLVHKIICFGFEISLFSLFNNSWIIFSNRYNILISLIKVENKMNSIMPFDTLFYTFLMNHVHVIGINTSRLFPKLFRRPYWSCCTKTYSFLW